MVDNEMLLPPTWAMFECVNYLHCKLNLNFTHLVKTRYIMKKVHKKPSIRNDATHCITAMVCSRLLIGINRGANSKPKIFILLAEWIARESLCSTNQSYVLAKDI